ncbi:MAG: ABC transporter ATP-binding protein, partial [Myxococcales bacterium]|nr:ABC transporter ATP-binding protein [Myxococcales bacterium]
MRDLRVDYVGAAGRVRAVDRVSFAIGPGEVLGLAGESGSGKSTIAQAILRILQPPAEITGGSIRVRGRDVLAMTEAELREVRWRDVALVMQSAISALNPVVAVGEQIIDAIRAHRPVSRKVARDRAALLLDRVRVGAGRLG